MLPSIFDENLEPTGYVGVYHIVLFHTEMTGNTIERLMKLYCMKVLTWFSLVHIRI